MLFYERNIFLRDTALLFAVFFKNAKSIQLLTNYKSSCV